MKKLLILSFVILLIGSCSDLTNPGSQLESNTSQEKDYAPGATTQSTTDFWVTAYMASWNHDAGTPYSNWGDVETDQIKWDAITHMIYFALEIGSDGTPNLSLDPEVRNNFNADRLDAITQAAHQNNTSILFSVGGAGNYEEFSSAIQEQNRDQFIATIKDLISTYGFDGVDIDMEPINSSDYDNYRAFIQELHSEFDTFETNSGNRPLLTAAVDNGDQDLFGTLTEYFDQINMMNYDMVQAWEGWQTFHHTALFQGSYVLESTGEPFPSVNQTTTEYQNAGVTADKLGVGVDFNGYVWNTVHFMETWASWPSQDLSIIENSGSGGTPYKDLAPRFNLDQATWDSETQTSYLNTRENGQKVFVAFDNARSIQRKVQYAQENGLGGVMIWSYAEDFMSDGSQPLLQAVDEQAGSSSGGGDTGDTTPPDVSIASPSNGDTISGTVTVDVQTSDNTGVERVELFVDGNLISELASPYDYELQTDQYSDASHTISVTSIDAAGNQSTASIDVTVNNTTDSDDGSGSTMSGNIIYDDQLGSPWHDASWSAAVNYGSTQRVYDGSSSIRIDQDAWGAASFLNGAWGSTTSIPANEYDSVKFAIYSDQQLDINLMIQNEAGDSFPNVDYGTVQAGSWTVVSVPLSELNPDDRSFYRVNIMESSGNAKTYFVDNLRLSGTSSSDDGGSTDTTPPDASIASPADGATLSGTATIDVQTSDNTGVDLVELFVDGSFVSELTSPYDYSWQTDQYSDGSHTVTVNSSDAAGNTNSATINVSIDNTSDSDGGDGSSLTGNTIYEDQLKSPWHDASWSAELNYSSTGHVYSGSSAIKVVQDAWGAASFLNGDWGSTTSIPANEYDSVTFAIYSEESLNVNLMLQNEAGDSFPNVDYDGSINVGDWTLISVPLSELNPDDRSFYRVNIMESSGNAKTYFVDEFRLIQTE